MTDTILFSDWAVQWLESIHGTIKENTYEATYRNSVFNHLIPYFGNRYIDSIKPIELQIFLNQSANRFSVDTVKKFKSCLKQIFDDAVYNGYCEKNPCYKLKTPHNQYTDTIEEDNNIYTPEQMFLIEDFAFKHRFGLDILLLLETGMRRGEMLGLPWENVDLNNKAIYIKQALALIKENNTLVAKIGPPKNKSSNRVIPISTDFTAYLANQKKLSSSEYVIHNKENGIINPRTWQRRHYDVFMSDLQKEYVDMPVLNPHRLRHSKASKWVNEGLNLYAIAKALGHSDLNMLKKRYAHSDLEEVRKLLNLK